MSVVLQFLKDLSPVKLAAIGLALVSFIILCIIYVAKISSHNMVLLYSNLDIEDSGKIVQELDNKKIPYQLLDGGTVIKVPKDKVVKARVDLAQIGVPVKGSIIGYEIFDKEDSIGTTNFSQHIKMIRALEGELARSIATFAQVDKVRVHLVLPQREVFSKARLEPKASVIIKFKQAMSFTKAEVNAVSHLVVTAVPGLDMKNLTLVDTSGKSLKLGAQEDSAEFGSMRSEEYRIAYEDRLKKVIEELLEQSLGFGKAKAQVAAEINFDRIVINSELYDPDSAVVRSTQSVDEREATPIAGEDNVDVSVANNIPGAGFATSSGVNMSTVEKNDQTTNYEISKTVKNQISETGIVTRLSIGVLVDGIYKLNATTNANEYQPRSKEELDQIANLVKVAVGFNQDRGDKIEVVNMPFSTELNVFSNPDDSNWLREELPNLFQTLVFAVVLVLVLVTIIRPIALKVFEIRKEGDSVFTTNVSTANIVDTEAKTDKRSTEHASEEGALSTRMDNKSQKVNELVTFYPQEMLGVLRKWLDEGK